MYPQDDFILARSEVPAPTPEDDLFAGIQVTRLTTYAPRRRAERGADVGGSAMAKYLTQEWLDLQRELAQEFPERPGATARMQYVVTGRPTAT